MRGTDHQQSHMFSYLSPEQRVRGDHPLRAVRAMVDEVLRSLSPQFSRLYAREGRPSIAPEKLLRALVVQMLYSIRSERLLMENIDYSILFRWFVGLNLDEEVWDATSFTKNRERLLEGDVAKQFLAEVVELARAKGLSPTSTSRWTARCWKRGRARRAFSRERERIRRRTILAIRRSTSGGNGGRMKRTNRRPIRRPSWRARATARNRS
jgi:transposase